MKKFLIPIATAIVLGFVSSCSDDECDHSVIQPDSSSLLDVAGNWYEEATNEEMRYNENGTFYDRYCNTTRSGETEGRWEYDQANRRLTWTYSFMGQTQFSDWTVDDLTEMSLTISSTTVAAHTLERIVESYQLEVGQTANIQFASDYPSYSVSSYTSKNERLASVDNQGVITAEGEKGTTYIKVETDKGNVWVRVTVGDDCLDLWYDYVSLMGADYATVREALGVPSIDGGDGYSFGFTLELSDVASEIDVFLDMNTARVNEMALALKTVPEAEILAYMDAHYYPYEFLGDGYYTTCPSIDESMAVVRYDKENNCIRFLEPGLYSLPDYTNTFGWNTEQIVAQFGELFYGYAMYDLVNIYAYQVWFDIDETTDKVSNYTLFVNGMVVPEDLHALLSSKYNFFSETEGRYNYRDGDSNATSNVGVTYYVEDGMIIFIDLKALRESANSKSRALTSLDALDFWLTPAYVDMIREKATKVKK